MKRGSRYTILPFKLHQFAYCDGAYSGFTDAHLNDLADFWGHKTNQLFIVTELGNHDAPHTAIPSAWATHARKVPVSALSSPSL